MKEPDVWVDYFGAIDLRYEDAVDDWAAKLNLRLIAWQDGAIGSDEFVVVGFQAIPSGDFLSVIVHYRVRLADDES